MTTQQEKSDFLHVMQRHIGSKNGVGMKSLARSMNTSERHCRHIISDLREEGVAICSTPPTGYYMATCVDDLNQCCDFLRSRAMHSLRIEARLRHMALPELINQLRFVEL